MTPLDEAQFFVFESCRVLAPVQLERSAAAGLVLAAPVVSTEEVPPFPNTAVDGYAVRASDLADVPVELDVVGEIAAGEPPDGIVGPGQAIRIMTGAPMPEGADAVAMVSLSSLPGSRQ